MSAKSSFLSITEKITADFIPHKEFHKGTWLSSTPSPCWYYFLNKPSKNFIRENNFITSVDKPLRELVSFLHERGVQTTPSCSGHNKTKSEFEIIYSVLEKEKDIIRKGGLNLKDVESGKCYSFRNEQYELPWSREFFLQSAIRYQRKGIVGMRIEKKDVKHKILSLSFKNTNIYFKDSILFIETSGSSDWKEITRTVKIILRANHTY